MSGPCARERPSVPHPLPWRRHPCGLDHGGGGGQCLTEHLPPLCGLDLTPLDDHPASSMSTSP